jgi:transmembrane sensor
VNKNYDDIDDLIAKYFSGEASSEESAVVEAWRNENPTNQKQFDQYKTILLKASENRSDHKFDTDAAWNKLKSKIQVNTPARVVRMRPEVAISKAFLRLAASIVILITVGFFTYRLFFPERDRLEIASERTVVRDTLPDGTNIVVNKRSRVQYSFNSRRREHRVKLAGEAFFTINSKKNKKFIVDAGGVIIRDIGTSFNVKAYPDSDTVEVYVQQGEVIIERDDEDPIHLTADNKVVYLRGTNVFLVGEPQPNAVAYTSRIFDFSNESLENVIGYLNQVYEKKIIISDSLKTCRLTVSFNNEGIDEIAGIIAETLGLTVQQSENQIKLEGKGCE